MSMKISKEIVQQGIKLIQSSQIYIFSDFFGIYFGGGQIFHSKKKKLEFRKQYIYIYYFYSKVNDREKKRSMCLK
jgi:hypothetical protein